MFGSIIWKMIKENFLAWTFKYVYTANLKTSKNNGHFRNLKNYLRQIYKVSLE